MKTPILHVIRGECSSLSSKNSHLDHDQHQPVVYSSTTSWILELWLNHQELRSDRPKKSMNGDHDVKLVVNVTQKPDMLNKSNDTHHVDYLSYQHL